MGTETSVLNSRRILVCVTASIAAYKAVSLVRLLVKNGAHVSVALTPNAQRFVGEATFSAVASEPTYVDLWDNRGSIAHTTLGKNSDLVVVVPATASTIAKMANGIADDIVTASLLCVPNQIPIVVAPAMHEEMFDHASTQENIQKLISRGVKFVGPVEGELAGGDTGRGRLVDEQEIFDEIVKALDGQEYKQLTRPIEQNQNIESQKAQHEDRPLYLITAGGTREPIDPVRVITNRSTGKMGHALANAASVSGYRVVLITTSDLSCNDSIERVDVNTSDEMHEAVLKYKADADVIIMTAAVADAKPKNPSNVKIKRENGFDSVELVPTQDIIADLVANNTSDAYIVCFAAESDDVVNNATKKFESKGVDLLIANDISRTDSGFGSDTNKVWIFGAKDQAQELPTLSKAELSYELIELIENYRSAKI